MEIEMMNSSHIDNVLEMSKVFYASDALDHAVPMDIIEENIKIAVSGNDILTGYVICEDNKPVGFSYVTCYYETEVGGVCAQILDLYIDSAYRGRGYALQAARAVLGYAFTKAGAPFVNGGCDKDNRASYRVMEKAGMRRAGEHENGDPIFYLSKETYLDDIKIAGAAGLQDLPR